GRGSSRATRARWSGRSTDAPEPASGSSSRSGSDPLCLIRRGLAPRSGAAALRAYFGGDFIPEKHVLHLLQHLHRGEPLPRHRFGTEGLYALSQAILQLIEQLGLHGLQVGQPEEGPRLFRVQSTPGRLLRALPLLWNGVWL